MVSLLLFVLSAVLVLVKLWRFAWRRPPNFPPGPPQLPLLGSYPILLALNYRHMHRAVERLAALYKSPILGFHHGPFPIVVCNDLATVREALRNPDLDGKPNIVLTQMRAPDNRTRGLFFTDKEVWRDNRRFSLRHMRDFGYGRRQQAFELDALAEVQDLVRIVREGPRYEFQREFCREGGWMRCPDMFYVVTGNAALRALCNEMLSGSEDLARLHRAGGHSMVFAGKADAFGRIFSLLPFLPAMAPVASGYAELREASMGLYGFVEELIGRQWREYAAVAGVAEGGGGVGVERSFLELYFKEMRENGNEKSFNLDQLVMSCVDYMLPAFSTLSLALSYMVQRWIAEPAVLRRIQAEIDDIVGRGRLPELDDRAQLPYTEAAIRETLRLRTIIPSGFPHRALRATKLAGYDIPKGAFIVTNLQAAHWNSDQFADALEFRPERFLGADGRLALAKDTTLPFGAGKRLCAGETFSRNMLFVLVAALAQNFDVRVSDEERWSTDVEDCRTGIVSMPKEMWVQFVER